MAGGAATLIVVPRPWIAALSFVAGVLLHPIEAAATEDIPGSYPEKKNIREVLKAISWISVVFMVVYGFEAYIYYEKWFVIAALALGGLLPLAEQQNTAKLWIGTSIAYATAWSVAGYYGPASLWVPAFGVLVTCGGIRPVLASYHC